MAEDNVAGHSGPKASWPKLFTAFRVALDLKKLLLAAGGIVATAVGWTVFGWMFYETAEMPKWGPQYSSSSWQDFRRDRDRWNLLHEMAGTVADKPGNAIKVDAGDKAGSKEEFNLLEKVRAGDLTVDQLKADAKSDKLAAAALATYELHLQKPATKPFGRLRSWPWSEERGPNQYLLAAGLLRKDAEGQRSVPWAPGQFLRWLLGDQLPVLVEPLMKFMAPIGYFFNSSAGGFRIRLYLILIILWTLATWGFFGGAICRIAAVQIARNEKISMGEAIAFAKEKFLNLFTAPLFPLIFLGILTLFLAVFGFIDGYTFWFGDIFLAGLLWPVVLVLGLIMAVVVVGLVGWPLMNPTIAAEGSDNFDALSRSYSYVYQAFWHYLGYWALALVYGAALVFFIGFMGSLVVYLGKWGLSQAPLLTSADAGSDREPSYLFMYAPTSFEWRDLLIKDNHNHVEPPNADHPNSYEFTKDYVDNHLSIPNKIGAVLVGAWVGLFFLLVVGFAYSYFWTASTLIYFLMRQHVDDTELDEVYFEEGDAEPPPSANAPAPPAPAAKPGTMSLNVVENAPVAAVAPPMPPPTEAPPGNPPPAATP